MPATNDDLSSVLIRHAVPSEFEQLVRIDDDAASLFADVGLDLSGEALRSFAEAERERWLHASERGMVELAVDAYGAPVGFMALGHADGLPYLEQLSVVRSWMRRGLGSTLLKRAFAWSEAAGELWLTTYAHLPWNAPMYARAGFVAVDETRCGPELREILREQRAGLPEPAQRVAMVRRHG